MSDNYDEIIVNKFTEESAKQFRKQVISRAMQDSSAPILVYIDSYGGYVDSLNSMLETIEQVHNPIVTICMGKAMSCGAVLLAAGDHRFCGRSSRVMIHQSSSGAVGPTESLQNDVDESKRLNEQFMKFISKRCGMTVKQFRDTMQEKLIREDEQARDWYLDAEAALELGIIDFIGMPHVKPVTMFSIEPAPEKTYKSGEETTNETLAGMGLTQKGGKKKATKKKVTKKKTTKKKTTRRK